MEGPKKTNRAAALYPPPLRTSYEGSSIEKRTGDLFASFRIPFRDITIGQEIGGGGFGTVSGAKYAGEAVAVKRLRRLSPNSVSEFEREAETMSRLRHPRVVSLYGICMEDPVYALVMELMPGGSLADLLHSSEEILWQERLQIAADIASGLTYLHKQGVVHCDLKSLNVLLDKGRRAKLADFGLSRVKSENSTYGTGQIGTVYWTAPELITGEGGVRNSKAADIYSLGVILWELGSRTSPFKGKQLGDAVKLIVQGIREPISSDTPLWMRELIEECWLLSAEKRPTSDDALRILQAPREPHVEKKLSPEEQLNQLRSNYKLREFSSGFLNQLSCLFLDPSCTEIDFSLARINDESARLLSEAVKINPPSFLTEIDLRGNMIADEGAQALATSLPGMRSLKIMNLKLNKIGASGAGAVGDALETNLSLTRLDLSKNPIGIDGSSALSLALKVNSTLTELNLSATGLGDKGLIALSQALSVNTGLSVIVLWSNGISAEGLNALAAALQSNTRLTSLGLRDNKIRSAEVQSLARAVKSNASLTFIDLGKNRVGDTGATALIQALESNASLRKISLDDNPLSEQNKRKIGLALAARV